MLKSPNASRFLICSAVAAAIALSAVPTFAAVVNGDYVGKTAAEITESLEKRGYKVNEIKEEEGNLEAKAVLDGTPYEIYTDPGTGKIIEVEEDNEENEGSIIKRWVFKLFGIASDED